ncbi:MAG: hypothetical protein EBW41_02850 [Actinobacteria bacterium]|nr:hypothetical protein [Actinomycetota bacterium]
MFKKFLSILIFISLSAPHAYAETGYRYWGYFQAPSGATSWTPAMTGPSIEVKDDPDFAELCGQTSEVSGKVRVGLVVDFGVGEIAPDGETPREFFSDCVVVPQGSVGLDVLEAVLDVRAADSGLICGIAGYPAQECGAEIDMDILTAPINDIAPVSDTESSSGNSPALLALAVVALLVGLVAVRRRKKS